MIIRIQLDSKVLAKIQISGYACTVTLTLEVWPRVKVMTHPLSQWTTTVWNIIQIQHGSEELWSGYKFGVCLHCDLGLGRYDLGSKSWHTIEPCDNNCVKYYPDPTWQRGVMARTRILGMCALWPWPWRYDLESGDDTPFGKWTTIVWNIIQIQHGSEELWAY